MIVLIAILLECAIVDSARNYTAERLRRQVLRTQAQTVPAAWIRLLRAHAATTRAFSAELYAEHGLTINGFEALLHLSRAEDRRLRRVDLAESLLLTASGVTRLLD